MNETVYYTKYAVVLTLLLKDEPQSLQILLYVLWRKGVGTTHTDRKWHFNIADIARQLGKNEKTIRKHLKPLKDLELIHTDGAVGQQYYVFNEAKYAEFLATDPGTVKSDTTTTNRSPSHILDGGLLPKSGRLKKAEEKKADLSCTVLNDSDTFSAEKESNPSRPVQDSTENLKVKETPQLFNTPTPVASISNKSLLPHVVNIGDSIATVTVSGTTENKSLASTLAVIPHSTGESALPGRSNGGNIKPESADITATGASNWENGKDGKTGGVQGGIATSNQFPPLFVASETGVQIPLPSGVSPKISARRQDSIVKALNKGGFNLIKENPTYTMLGRFKVCAVDKQKKQLLMTADQTQFVNTKYVQDLCREYYAQDWELYLWTADDQSIYCLIPWSRKPQTNPQDQSGISDSVERKAA